MLEEVQMPLVWMRLSMQRTVAAPGHFRLGNTVRVMAKHPKVAMSRHQNYSDSHIQVAYQALG